MADGRGRTAHLESDALPALAEESSRDIAPRAVDDLVDGRFAQRIAPAFVDQHEAPMRSTWQAGRPLEFEQIEAGSAPGAIRSRIRASSRRVEYEIDTGIHAPIPHAPVGWNIGEPAFRVVSEE